MWWMLFFAICDWFCSIVPNKDWRDRMRQIRLYDWRRKYDALRRAYPEMKFFNTRLVKGGWNIGFIVRNKYVFKIRKYNDKNSEEEKIIKQKRITDALGKFSPLRILKLEIVKIDNYTFYKYDFIPGKNLNVFPKGIIMHHKKQWSKQIAEFIYKIHNARPNGIADLIDCDGDGWNHNDICNNIIVDPKSIRIIGMIDWEYAGWGLLETELENCTRFSKKLRECGFDQEIRDAYKKLCK